MGLSLSLLVEKFLNKQDKQSEKDLIMALKEAEFLTAVFFVAPLAKESGEPAWEESFSFVSLDDGNARYIPAFSSKDELELWQDLGEHEVLICSLKELSVALDVGMAGIVINPFSSSIILNKNTLDKILNL
ncbi:SseB family protein [Campylobacter sp. 19-13652]|uniref:SseB family protein n=1 Tax=Campylobacter sp. 19-13652 TaxID=2840180 RepID=UPI001C7658BF|nr:SseB family protein [Campylobacter sp. 19-13652]BCX79732.1 hypothetical protein LBC_11940 [Campylobacter sp. 19-13652]